MRSVLWVDDEPWTVRPEIDLLDSAFYDVKLVSSLTRALRELRTAKRAFDLIVVDCINRVAALGEQPDTDLPGSVKPREAGIALGRVIREKLGLRAPIVFYSVVSSQDVKARAVACGGIVRYVVKVEDAAPEIERLLGGGGR
jgi:CheY-like chemotaxis protein